jgi:hypothetical protein
MSGLNDIIALGFVLAIFLVPFWFVLACLALFFEEEPLQKLKRNWSFYLTLGVASWCCVALLSGPRPSGIKRAPESAAMQQCRSLALSMFQYANDNDQIYPDGKSSTEVFQKLLDGGYVSDPTLFYIPMPGKIKPHPGQKLKPENVSFDVTFGVDSQTPDEIPVVFMTGYKVAYAPGAMPVPLGKTIPRFGMAEPPGFFEWLTGRPWPPTYPDSGGIAVAYKSNSARFLQLDPPVPTVVNGSITTFIPAKFNANGRTYIQLTPDGPLAR